MRDAWQLRCGTVSIRLLIGGARRYSRNDLRMTRRRAAHGGGVLATASALAGLVITSCQSTECPGPLPISAVAVHLAGWVLPYNSNPSFSACVDSVCRTKSYTLGPRRHDSRRPTNFGVDFSSIPADTTVTVSVRIKVGARVIFSGSTRTQTVKNQPGGPDCGAAVWDVGVTAHRGGTLT